MSIGLLAYYGLTSLVGGAEQSRLRESGAWATEAPAATGPTLDFSSWGEEDRAYWDSLKPGEAFGRLVCESMGLDAMVVKGSSSSALRKGPGWVEWTDLPGPTGNFGIAGHRTTYGAWFRRIDRVRTGDSIDFFSPYRRYRYRVSKTDTVLPSRGRVMQHTEAPQLTLSACHPPYSAKYRFIVSADLIEVRRLRSAEETRTD